MVQPLPTPVAASDTVAVDLSSMATACPAEAQSGWQTLQALLIDGHDSESSEIHVEPDHDCLRLRFRSAFDFQERRLDDGRECLESMRWLCRRLDLQDDHVNASRAWFTCQVARQSRLYQFDVIRTRKGDTYRLLRMDDCQQIPARLEDIGLNRAQMSRLDTALRKRHGLVVVAGNLDSARRHTSRAIAQRLVAPDRRIVMADVPMHPFIPRTTQMELDYPPTAAQQQTWDALCRQRADALVTTQPMLDGDARRLANLASSESLVIQALRAGSAADCLSRLLALGIRGETLAHCLSLIVVQYRVRRLCTRCRVSTSPDDRGTAWLARFSPIQAGNINDWLRHRMQSSFSRAEGCQHCNHTGHKQWLDIFDIINIDNDLREAMYDGDQHSARAMLADRQSLGESLLKLAQDGIIALDEAIRVTGEMDEPGPCSLSG